MTSEQDENTEPVDKTLPANPQWQREVLASISSGQLSPPAGMIAIYPLGRNRPYLIEVKQARMTLGRQRSGESAPDVDFTAFQGTMHGVSRQHAALLHGDDGYALEDLGSTNGSWVNEEQLTPHEPHPLKNGDLIRLGQFVFFIHFSG